MLRNTPTPTRPGSATDTERLTVITRSETSNANSSPTPSMQKKRVYNYEDLIKAQHEDEDEEIAEAEHYAMMKEIKSLESTSLWLRPLASMFEKFRLLCCSYNIRLVETTSSMPTTLADVTKVLTGNITGLLFGIGLGFAVYILFLYTFSRQPDLSTFLSAYLMLLSVYGLAFSSAFRTVTLLTIPYLAASRVRWLLMLYATSASVTGPVFNFLHNSGNFRNGVACILSQINTNIKLIQRLSSAPFALLKDQFVGFIAELNGAVEKMRSTMTRLDFNFVSVTNVMGKQSNWVLSLLQACEHPVKLENQCLSFFNNIFFNCEATLWSAFAFLCKTIRLFANDTCREMESLHKLCRKQTRMLQTTTGLSSIADLKTKSDKILDLLGRKNMTLTGKFDHLANLTVASDNAFVALMRHKMTNFVSAIDKAKIVLGWVMLVWTLITMLLIVVQAAIYRQRWLLVNDFDNYYLTHEFVQQEKRAVLQGLVPTIPLVRGERARYKKLSSLRWTTSEKAKAFRSLVVLVIWMTSLILAIASDYAMYYLVTSITPLFDVELGQLSKSRSGPRSVQEIKGNSSLATVVRSFTALINPMKEVALDIDAKACKPKPNQPNDRVTGLIILALVATLFSIIFEVYILRLRHVILGAYHPNRATQRAAWLRMHIRNNRGLFHRLIHKFRTLEVRPGRTAPNSTRFGRFLISNPWIRRGLSYINIRRENCSFCGEEGNPNKPEFKENFIRCLECGSYYCRICQVDLEHICMHCRTPMFAISVEVDLEEPSEDEEFEQMCAKYLKRTEQSATVVLARGEEKAPTLSITRRNL